MVNNSCKVFRENFHLDPVACQLFASVNVPVAISTETSVEGTTTTKKPDEGITSTKQPDEGTTSPQASLKK